MVTPQLAAWMRQWHPLRMQYEMFGRANPFMAWLSSAADNVRKDRSPAAADNPLVAAQEAASTQIVNALDAWRDTRDNLSEAMFLAIYGSPVLQAAVGVNPDAVRPRKPQKSSLHRELLQKRISELKEQISRGGLTECTIRGLLYIGMARGTVDERAVEALRRIRLAEGTHRLTLAQFKAMARDQFFLLLLDPEATLAAIPKLLPENIDERRKGLAAIRNVLSAGGEIAGEAAKRLEKITELFGINEKGPSATGRDKVSSASGEKRAKAS
jgi:hypothetical protein